MNWDHGGDLLRFEQEYVREPLDFSANVSPLPVPERVREAAAEALVRSGLYPDPFCRNLRQALAEELEIPADWILCGNGASDLIYRAVAALRPKQALLVSPCFSEYESALSLYGCRTEHFSLHAENGFLLTSDFLDQISEETELLFLGQPNNPTGRCIEPRLLRQILDRCDTCGTWLILDECFLDFLEDPSPLTLLSEVKGSRILILRAFTKFHALAGLRLGYAVCADPDLLSQMAQAGPPWPVSNVAQAAGIASLREKEYAAQLRGLIREERPFLLNALESCGCHVIPGEVNFLLFSHRDPELAKKLAQKGILIRNCSNFPGLAPGWYRTAVRTHRENERLIQAIWEAKSV